MSDSTDVLAADRSAVPAAPARTHVFSHIQGLRAVAVLLVVLYHLWPGRLAGGYVGVDVFFVVSGYLMTSHILRGAESGRSIVAGLNDFYGRRIRRILPAALLVLAVTSAVTLAFVSKIKWTSYLHEVLASTLYIENWSLASSSTDYLAAGTGASPVQHFWSLSVEEQFYLIWPLLLLTVVVLVRWSARSTAGSRPPGLPAGTGRWVLVLVVALITVSLAYSVVSTLQDSKFAYFDTFARLWEFGIGGLVATAGPLVRLSGWQAAFTSWIGLLAIAVASMTFSGDTEFPGWIALIPVLGASAVVMAGERASRWGPQSILAWQPVQFIGGISYSLYLWHWPLIVLVPAVLGTSLGTGSRIGLLAVSIAVAWVSKVLVEDPLRTRAAAQGHLRQRAARPWRLYAITLLAMVVVGSGSVIGLVSMNGQISAARAALAASRVGAPVCFGAEVLTAGSYCARTGPSLSSIIPNPLVATEDFPVQGCQQVASRGEILTCTFGSTAASAVRVALAGDSHATQWLPALLPIAQANNWSITTYVKSGCPLSSARTNDACGAWNAAALPDIRAGGFKYVFVSARGYSGVGDAEGSDIKAYTVGGMTQAFGSIAAGGAEVVAIRDIPQPTNAGVTSIPSCVFGNSHPQNCDFSETRATRFDLIPAAAAGDPHVRVVDMNQAFCSAKVCPPIIGKVLVYLDGGHMTATYARSLTSALDLQLSKLGVAKAG